MTHLEIRPAQWACLMALAALAGCAEVPREPNGNEEGNELGQHTQALCPTGPAFPSCYGNCGFLDCSPIDPGACCACDEDCADRGDCCCDYEQYCVAPPPPPDSCEGRCGGPAPAGCFCDDACTGLGDCCGDFTTFCEPPSASCEGHCGGSAPAGCFCDTACTGFGDCCDDYATTCACTGGVTPAEADERVAAIAVGPSGELYVAGTRAPPAGFASDASDGFVRRVHPTTFATLWDRTIDNCFWDTANGLAVLPSGDVVVVGATRTGTFASTPARVLVRRYTSAGNEEWQATPTISGDSVAHAVAIDPADQSLVITGAASSSVMLLRLDGSGSTLLSTSIAGTTSSTGKAVAVATDRVISIVTRDLPDRARVLSVTSAGALRWTFNEVAGSVGIDVAVDPAGSVFALSNLRSGSTHLARLTRLTSSGATTFSQVIDLGGRRWNPAAGLVRETSGSLIVAGNTSALDGSQRAWLARYTASGVQSFSRVRASPIVNLVADVAVQGSVAWFAAQHRPSTLTQTLVLRETL